MFVHKLLPISILSLTEDDVPTRFMEENVLEQLTMATVVMRSFTEEVMITSDVDAYDHETTNAFRLKRGDWIGSAMELISTANFM